MSDQDPHVQEFDLPLPEGVDHCYRHPDRETGVHCANCGRPICHDCMTPAAVGFRCPECMAEQRQQAGRARVITRTQTRSRWQSGAFGRGGLTVTKVLVGLNVAMFVVELLTGALNNPGEMNRLGALVPFDVIVKHEYWRMVSVMFLHAGYLHILFNMWALWVLGDYVESVLGHIKFAVLYMTAGLMGSALILVASPLYVPTVGASGAIYGLFGALAVYAYLNRNRDQVARSILGQIVILLAINLIFTFSAGGVSWQGHIGGLAMGAALMGAYCLMGRKSPYGKFTSSDIVATVVAVAFVIGLTYWKVATTVVAVVLHVWR